MNKLLTYILAFLALTTCALAQPGPGPQPSPFIQSGSSIQPLSNTSGMVLPSGVAGGYKGAGTINAQGLYVNGVAVNTSSATVTSVGLSLPSIFTVTVSPITSSGDLTAILANEDANKVFAGPTTGAAAPPTFRALVADDIPSLSSLYLSLTGGGTVSGAVTLSNVGNNLGTPTTLGLANATGLPLTGLAAQTADTVVMNATAGSASPTAVSVNNCSTSSSALTYNTTTHAWGCNTISGSGTVNSGNQYELAYYATGGTAVSGLTTGNNGLLVTSGAGIPSISSTIPAAAVLSNGVTATTQAANDNGTKVATTAYANQMPHNYVGGLTLSTAGSSATFSIATGSAEDSTNVALMILASAYSKTTGAWAVGTGNGCLDTGSIAGSTWYSVFLIERVDTFVVDVLCSTNATSPSMPTNYTLKRRIGSMKTDGSSNWTAFVQIGNNFRWVTPTADYGTPGGSAYVPGVTTRQSKALNVPTGVAVFPVFAFQNSGAGAGMSTLITSLDETDSAPSYPGNYTTSAATGANSEENEYSQFHTNNSSQIGIRVNATDGGYWLVTKGWNDDRGCGCTNPGGGGGNPLDVVFSTGDVKFTLKTTADSGWIMANDGTIGSATSGADYANAAAQALFLLLWNNVSDTWAPVVGGRGASAAADWAANKKITLTKMLGRVLGLSGSGAGLTARALGESLGAEATGLPANAQANGGSSFYTVATPTNVAIMQPTSFLNVMIKL